MMNNTIIEHVSANDLLSAYIATHYPKGDVMTISMDSIMDDSDAGLQSFLKDMEHAGLAIPQTMVIFGHIIIKTNPEMIQHFLQTYDHQCPVLYHYRDGELINENF